ncbi:hypothetical protein [Antarctobacter sp.]|uniref:hypothetical protein n=1 Tax=Antarctobacter sp. TaxID=1872577 RepID=UPI002B271AFD|nr:hypothetical protein [Antarctobacter sp.]
MPAVFNIAALLLPQTQTLGMPQAAKSAARLVPQSQAQFAAQATPSAAAPFGAGTPMATGAVLPPSAQLPVPAPPPVVSTNQTGLIAAAAINGLDRAPDDRQRDPHQNGRDHRPALPDNRAKPRATSAAQEVVPKGLPGGPAPAATGGTTRQAAPGYGAARMALHG